MAGGLAIALLVSASALPDLSSQDAVEYQVGRGVEATRENGARGTRQIARPLAVNDGLFLAPAGKALLAAYGCPGLPGAPAESEPAFRLRLARALGGDRGPPSPGRCELTMGLALAEFLRLEEPATRLIAADRIRAALPHHELLALWGSSYAFTPEGPFGLDEAAGRLYGKPAVALDWNEAALLALASDLFEEVETCRHPPRLTSLRDPFLDRLAQLYPAEAQIILLQKRLPLPCDRPLPGGRSSRPAP